MSSRPMKAGFTLVELSIVLVILGLLVGGVLSGQSLIHSAQLRSVVTERDQYATAANTFKSKYLALPGDMPNAWSFWGNPCGSNATPATAGVSACNGDGDGKVAFAEGIMFWKHLELAGLITGTTTPCGGNGTYRANHMYPYGFSSGAFTTNICVNYPGVTIPASKMGGNLGWSVFYSLRRGANTAQLSITPTTQNNSTAGYGTGGGLAPEDVYSIDMKMDDGLPNTGNVDAGPKSNTGCYTLPANTYTLNNPAKVCPVFIKLGT